MGFFETVGNLKKRCSVQCRKTLGQALPLSKTMARPTASVLSDPRKVAHTSDFISDQESFWTTTYDEGWEVRLRESV